MMKILVIFGTRPEAIKLSPVIRALEEYSGKNHGKQFRPIVCTTSQHKEMLNQVLKFFGIVPHYNLRVMRHNQNLFDIIKYSVSGLSRAIMDVSPQCIIVQGDTTTTFIGALAGYYSRIPVAHVEAGLRSFNKFEPFPEEINRILTTHVADWHFTPTKESEANLFREGIDKGNIFVTGNPVIDSLFFTVNKITEDQKWVDPLVLSITDKFEDRKMILVTAHRRESFGDGIKNICRALKAIVEDNPDVTVVWPVHLNPNVIKPVIGCLSKVSMTFIDRQRYHHISRNNLYHKRLILLPPVNYPSLVWLLKSCYAVLTDSGGIQEEAPSLGKPVLVMRKVTERPEGVRAGVSRLVGTDWRSIVNGVSELLHSHSLYRHMSQQVNPYGDGNAAKRIVRVLSKVIPPRSYGKNTF